MKRRDVWLLATSIGVGVLIFQVGFRLTSEVLPVIALLVIGGVVFGFVVARRPLLWGLGIGVGTRLLPEVALSQEHIVHERPSHPLPLPFNLTDSAVGQWVVLSLVIMAFPFVGAIAGWTLRKVVALAARGLQQAIRT